RDRRHEPAATWAMAPERDDAVHSPTVSTLLRETRVIPVETIAFQIESPTHGVTRSFAPVGVQSSNRCRISPSPCVTIGDGRVFPPCLCRYRGSAIPRRYILDKPFGIWRAAAHVESISGHSENHCYVS